MKARLLSPTILLLCGLVATSLSCAPPATKNPAEETLFACTFTAEITALDIVGGHQGPNLPTYDAEELGGAPGGTLIIGHDAHWGALVTVKDTEGESSFLQTGETWLLVIHSPVQAFDVSADEAKGATLRLDLIGTKGTDGRLVFMLLRKHSEK